MSIRRDGDCKNETLWTISEMGKLDLVEYGKRAFEQNGGFLLWQTEICLTTALLALIRKVSLVTEKCDYEWRTFCTSEI